MAETRLSFVIPARNEEALIGETLEAILASLSRASGVTRSDSWLPELRSKSSSRMMEARTRPQRSSGASPTRLGAGPALRGGTCAADGTPAPRRVPGGCSVSSTRTPFVPENAVERILELHEDEGRCLVLFRLASREPGIRARLWWSFWGLARRLPLARAKSMPAFMSCDRAHFEPLRSVRRILRDRRGMAVDRGGLSAPPCALPLRSKPHRAHVQPADGAPAVRIRSNVRQVGLVVLFRGRARRPRSRSTRDRHRYRCTRAGWQSAPASPVPGSWAGCSGPCRYSKVRVVSQDGALQVRKHRVFFAPLLIWMSSAGEDSGHWRARPPPAGMGGAGAQDLLAPPRHVDSAPMPTGCSSCRASLVRRWPPYSRIRSSRRRSGRRPSNGPSSRSPSSIAGIHPRRRHGRERAGRPRGRSRALVRLRDRS